MRNVMLLCLTAFDKVPHSKLLTKMARYGIDDVVVRWMGELVVG